MTRKLVVIGAGMAAGRMLEHLTEAAPDAFEITLINAEPRGTYNRIMLSPVLAGDQSFDEIVTHDDAWYAARRIETRFGVRVASVDPAAKAVTLESGDTLEYDKLVFATGSAPFMIPMPGHDLDGVIAYRDVEDTQRMMALGAGAKAVVIGGGLLGLEAAAGMAARGADVTVVHIMDHLMERQLDAEAGGLLKASLESKGIRVLTGAQSQEILGKDGRARALLLSDGTELPCDLLVMAVGVRPNMALGAQAGLETARGIVVDDQMCTSDPDVLALGECVEHRGEVFGLVAPLFDQAKVAAQTLLGAEACYEQKPLSTKLKVTGCDLFSAGDFTGGPGREDIILRDRARDVYKRLVIEGSKLIGAVMYGETEGSNWFFSLIQEGRDIEPFRETLIFGPAYNGGDTSDPFPSAVAAWPHKPRMGCNGDLPFHARQQRAA